VREQLCDDKLCVGKLWGGQAAGGGRRPEAAGYRTKNKIPTQRCGEKTTNQIFDIVYCSLSEILSNGLSTLPYNRMVCHHFPLKTTMIHHVLFSFPKFDCSFPSNGR
jgi:hypothetical protein